MPKGELLLEVPLAKLRRQHKTMGALLGVMIGFSCLYVAVGGYQFLTSKSGRNTALLVAPLMALVTTTVPVAVRRRALSEELARREKVRNAS